MSATVICTFNEWYVLWSAWKINCELVTPSECKDLCPLLNVDDIYGGIWMPEDGVADTYETCVALINEAQKMGLYRKLKYFCVLYS